MIAAFVLIAGVLFVSILGFIACYMMDIDHQVIISLVPFLPLLIAVGSGLLILVELLLLFGNKHDRRVCFADMCWLVPLLLISYGLFYYIHLNKLY